MFVNLLTMGFMSKEIKVAQVVNVISLFNTDTAFVVFCFIFVCLDLD